MTAFSISTNDPTVRDIATRIFETHRITRADQQIFMQHLLSKSTITPEEEQLINTVFAELKRGVLRVAD